jgi:hypothetical protein
MAVRKKNPAPKVPEFPKVVETFRCLGAYEMSNIAGAGWAEPSCFNGSVSIHRYRVTVELIDEPKEVLAERLLNLWRNCDNHHHIDPLRWTAREIGIELDLSEFGKFRKG